MYGTLQAHLQQELAAIEQAGLFKRERIITGEQAAEITVNGRQVLNFCANNYLGLSSAPRGGEGRACHPWMFTDSG
jgi:glycine C-acetyltransferase